jgi:hypothetical protein
MLILMTDRLKPIRGYFWREELEQHTISARVRHADWTRESLVWVGLPRPGCGISAGPQQQGTCSVKKIYVGNLSFDTTDSTLRTLFSAYGTISSATVLSDRETGRSRGFGFVEMENDSEAMAAITGLNGKAVDGRNLNVNEARPREPRQGGGGGGGGGGGRPRW